MYHIGCVIIILVYFWRGKGEEGCGEGREGMSGREGRDVGKEGKGCGEGRGGMWGRERRDLGREGRDVGR